MMTASLSSLPPQSAPSSKIRWRSDTNDNLDLLISIITTYLILGKSKIIL